MLEEINEFLPCETPPAWLNVALENLDLLLVDHANCEKKAAATAMNLMYRHVEHTRLMLTMSRLAREELLHFQQVVSILQERGIPYRRIGPSRYAAGLRDHMDPALQNGLVDTLIIGAFIEARSCERFARLAPLLDEGLAKFYRTLVRSEGRHFRDYLDLARECNGGAIDDRVAFFARVERDLVLRPDTLFRFHSGVPTSTAA